MRSVGKDEDIGKAGRDGPDQLSAEEMFSRFQEVARKVVNVQKSVIIEREREIKEQRKALRKQGKKTPRQ